MIECRTRRGYTAIYEQADGGGWSGHVPELPVILAAGKTRQETEEQMDDAIEVYLSEMGKLGLAVARPA